MWDRNETIFEHRIQRHNFSTTTDMWYFCSFDFVDFVIFCGIVSNEFYLIIEFTE